MYKVLKMKYMKAIFFIVVSFFSFLSVEKIITFGSAQILENDAFCKTGLHYLMTPNREELIGGIYGKKVDFSKDFTITYKYKQITNNIWNIPADGIALSFYENHNGFTKRGGGLGYIYNIDKGISFELDIYVNKEVNEAFYHTAIHIDGSNLPSTKMKEIELKSEYLVSIKWDSKASKFYFYLDKKLMHQYTYTAFNNREISWAISAATGGLYSEQCICLQAYP